MVGLDAAGKTTILYKLKLGEGMLSDKSLSWLRQSLDAQHIVVNWKQIINKFSPFRLDRSCYHHSYYR